MYASLLVIAAGLAIAFIGFGAFVDGFRKTPSVDPQPRQSPSPKPQPRDVNGRFVSPKVSVHEALRRDVEASRKAKS